MKNFVIITTNQSTRLNRVNQKEYYMRRITLILIVLLAAIALVACGGNGADDDMAMAEGGYAPNQTVEAYMYVHGGYVGQATASTDAEGNLDVEIDEAFLPHTLASVDMESGDWNEDNTVFYIQRGNEVRVAKWIAVGGTNYVGTTVGGALAYVEADEDGNPTGATILEKGIIRNQGSMAQYFNGVGNGAFQIFMEFGGDAMTVDTTSYGSVYKDGSSYWAEGTRGLGWQPNMNAIEEFVEENGADYSLDQIESTDDGWEVADTVTGATASDFVDYFTLVQLAVAQLDVQ